MFVALAFHFISLILTSFLTLFESQLGRLIKTVVPALGRAVKNAWTQSQTQAAQGASTSFFDRKPQIALDEAQQILGVKPGMTREKLQEVYDKMYTVNDRVNGGSFYLQGRIFRAKERIDMALEQGEMHMEGEVPRADSPDSNTATETEPASATEPPKDNPKNQRVDEA